MRKRNYNRGLRVQRLEDRRLLAADVAVDLVLVETAEPETVEVQQLDSQAENQSETVELDLDSTEISLDTIGTSIEEATAAPINDLGDPVDGTDGFFGSIDAENPNQRFSFSPSEDD